MKRIVLILVGVLVFTSVFAQDASRKWSVGLHGNLNAYQGDLGNGFFEFDEIWKDEGIGVSLEYYLSPAFDVTLKGTYFHLDYKDDNGTYSKGKGGYADLVGADYGSWRFNGDMLTGTANLKFKFNNGWLLKEESLIAPFAIGGVGVMRIHSESFRNTRRNSKNYSNMALYYGAGLNFRLSEYFNMIFEAGVYNPMTDVYDGIDRGTVRWKGASDSDDEFLQYSLGVSFNLGKKSDADGDGVSDKKDKCPDTPNGVTVDENGCPIDTDGDGVPDYLDKCPKVKGKIKGCPDTDGDGIIDSEDKCPKVKGLKELQGCPDGDDDKDGVANLKDKCPKTPVGVKVDSKGCPVDTDGDGVADYLDKCPKEAGSAKTQGCPVQEKLNEFAKQVYFNTNKSSLKTESFVVLDQVVDLLKKYGGSYKVAIKGYTDSQGSDTYNQKLSDKRAAVVKNYLIKKGIPADRLSSRGYGESNPVATNDTAEGRAQNRRTEIVVE